MKKSLIKISAAALVVLHGINRLIDNSASNIIPSKGNYTGKYYHWKNGDIYYNVKGNGEPLLLIHDLNIFSSSYEWSQIIDALSDSYTVYSVDLIGCGKSGKPNITYTNYFYVQMISAFVTDVIKSKTKVAATALSSSFVLLANSLNNELFSDIMLINPPTLSYLKNTPNQYSNILIRLFSLPVIGKTAYYIASNKPNTEYYLTEKCFYNPFNLKSSVTKHYYTAAHDGKGNGKMLLASLEGQYLCTDISKALKNAENRIVIVLGDHNEKKEEIRNSYLRLNENLIFETISDSKILPQLENSGEMIEILHY